MGGKRIVNTSLVLVMVLGLIVPVFSSAAEAQSFPRVKFRGTATTDELTIVWGYCGNYFVDIEVEEILQDPQNELTVGQEFSVIYQDAHNFSSGDYLGVYGTSYLSGGPMQCIGSVVVGGEYGSPEDYIVEEERVLTVSINPRSSSVSQGDTFDVEVRIENAVDLASYHFTMNFDPSVVWVLPNVEDGGFLGSTGREVIPEFPIIDVSGDLWALIFGATSFGDQPGPNGDGILANITLEAAGVGDSLLDLQNVRVFSTLPGPQAAIVVEDGIVHVEAPVSISIDPVSKTVSVGQTFTLDIEIEAGDQPVDGAEAHIDFDRDYLMVVDSEGNETDTIMGGEALPTELQNQADNSEGEIDYSAGILTGTPPTGTFTLASIRFKAIAETSETPIIFTFTSRRKTDVVFEGQSVLGEHRDGSVRIEAGASITGTVSLQGRPTPSDPSWSTPLTLTLHPLGGGEPNYTFTPTTDESGAFSVSGIDPGSYEAKVKNPHTLRNRKSINLISGPNEISFGTLLEGDANDDNCINITDFSLLRTAFATCEGDGKFDPRADFNEDGCVNISDFSLLRTNFGLCGDIEVTAVGPLETAAGAGTVSIALVPSSKTVSVGQVFTLDIEIEAGEQPVDGAEAHLDFDRDYLRVVDSEGNETDTIIGGEALPTELQNQADNSQGKIDYSAGILTGTPPTGTITLATIRFKAITETAGTELSFVFTAARKTDVVFEGSSVLGHHTDGNIAVTSYLNRVYLPLVLKE